MIISNFVIKNVIIKLLEHDCYRTSRFTFPKKITYIKQTTFIKKFGPVLNKNRLYLHIFYVELEIRKAPYCRALANSQFSYLLKSYLILQLAIVFMNPI